jgi:hypothetical protein
MSGPIVRKYGFPNFEKIFGERDLQHGVDESSETASEESAVASKPKAPAKASKPAKPAAKTKKKA